MKNYFKVINPYNGEVAGESPIHSRKEINDILKKTFRYRCELSGSQRSEILIKTIESFEEKKEILSRLITMETGLCLKDSIHEVDRAINCLKYCIKQAQLIEKVDLTREYSESSNNLLPELKVFSEPLDLAIGITPFNHPLNLVVHKVGPAIAAGTAMVIKPSEKTPLTATKLREILIENGLPEDMFNIVSGLPPKNIVDHLITYQNFDLISFTGSVTTGKYIARKMVNCGNELKKYIPELGGNVIFVIMDDCDVDLAAQLALGAFENSGQRCTAIRRILIHNDISNVFIDKFVNLTSKIKYGDPFNINNDMGTVISAEQANLIYKRVNKAIKEGADLLIGNEVDNAVYSPTAVNNVNPLSELVKHETFGPVVSIIKINNLDDAINYIKSDRFALASGIVSRSENNAHKLYKSICVGQFSWNGRPGYRTEEAPFGGFKDSGNGEKEGVVLMTRAMRRIRTFYRHGK